MLAIGAIVIFPVAETYVITGVIGQGYLLRSLGSGVLFILGLMSFLFGTLGALMQINGKISLRNIIQIRKGIDSMEERLTKLEAHK